MAPLVRRKWLQQRDVLTLHGYRSIIQRGVIGKAVLWR